MKKIITMAAFLAASFAYAQETTEVAPETTPQKGRHQFSLNAQYSDPSSIGIQYEYQKPLKEGKYASSHVVNLAVGLMNYEVGGFDTNGAGFVIELGGRNYFSNKHEGFYYSNFISYGNIKFSETISGVDFDGTYSYFSFFSPEIGYKIQLGDFSIDPFIGVMWKLEIKGKGDIDNKNVDEWAMRAGLKVGYRF